MDEEKKTAAGTPGPAPEAPAPQEPPRDGGGTNLALGLCVGLLLGTVLGNVGLGLCLGVLFGLIPWGKAGRGEGGA